MEEVPVNVELTERQGCCKGLRFVTNAQGVLSYFVERRKHRCTMNGHVPAVPAPFPVSTFPSPNRTVQASPLGKLFSQKHIIRRFLCLADHDRRERREASTGQGRQSIGEPNS